MLNIHDISYIKSLVITKLHNTENRLERVKLSPYNIDLEREISSEMEYLLTLIKKLEK